jgi:hypothetical protein
LLTKFRVSKKNLKKLRGKSSDVDYDGVPGGIRTHDPLLRRQPLYPTELQGRISSLTHGITLYQPVKERKIKGSRLLLVWMTQGLWKLEAQL